MTKAAVVAFMVLVACGDNIEPGPDAGSSADARAIDAVIDAAPDADPCWVKRLVTCGATIEELCVPYQGCVFPTCGGGGYCGPG